MSIPENTEHVQEAIAKPATSRQVWQRRMPRFRLSHIMLVLVLFAALIALGVHTTRSYHDQHQKLIQRRARNNIDEFVRNQKEFSGGDYVKEIARIRAEQHKRAALKYQQAPSVPP